MNQFRTEQENFWAGEFGNDYVNRNQGPDAVASNVAFFSRILQRTENVKSAIEFGANIGLNLLALRTLKPGIALTAIEINSKAVEFLERMGGVSIHATSILEYSPRQEHDLALIKGVLIHIDPEHLPDVYEKLYRAARRYICIAEYYNPTPVEVPYRGNRDKLFKRDFAGEMLDRFPDLRLVDYGFVYHRAPTFPQDDTTWFLMEKGTG